MFIQRVEAVYDVLEGRVAWMVGHDHGDDLCVAVARLICVGEQGFGCPGGDGGLVITTTAEMVG